MNSYLQVSNADAVSSFLAKGADVNYQDPRKGYTGLHWVSTCLRGKCDMYYLTVNQYITGCLERCAGSDSSAH